MGGITANIVANPLNEPRAPEKRFKYQEKKHGQFVHKCANVSTKQKFFFDELNLWQEEVSRRAEDTRKYHKNSMGDFDDLDQPISMMTKVKSDDNCFLSHPMIEDVYELNHGFIINNNFVRGDKLKAEEDERAPKFSCLSTSDPRHTRSLSSLQLPSCYDQDE